MAVQLPQVPDAEVEGRCKALKPQKRNAFGATPPSCAGKPVVCAKELSPLDEGEHPQAQQNGAKSASFDQLMRFISVHAQELRGLRRVD